MPRPPGAATPCGTCPKIPPDAPARTSAYAVELSDRNRRAWRHYQECAAVGSFPDDALVRRHAAVIASLLRGREEARHARLQRLLAGAIQSKTK